LSARPRVSERDRGPGSFDAPARRFHRAGVAEITGVKQVEREDPDSSAATPSTALPAFFQPGATRAVAQPPAAAPTPAPAPVIEDADLEKLGKISDLTDYIRAKRLGSGARAA